MPKTIFFRVDSSSIIGIGHVMRCLVLAKKYSNEGNNIIFVTQNLEGNINNQIRKSKYEIKILNSNNIEEFISLINCSLVDILVIDHYKINYNYEKKLKEATNLTIMCLDDTYKKHYCDILLNHNIYADELKYKDLVPEHCELRCGSNYTLLRDEFINAYRTNKNNSKKIFFIAMGGSDPLNLNTKILKVLEIFKNIKVNIVTTQSNQNLTELERYLKNKDWISLYVNCDFMAKLMVDSDYAIITPSVTSNEVYSMNLPFIAIKVAENQKYMYEYLIKNNFMTMNGFNKHLLSKYINEMLKKEEE